MSHLAVWSARIAAVMMIFVSAHALAADAISPKVSSINVASEKDSNLSATEILNRRRTQVTLFLYAPVLAEMLNQGQSETQSWMTKLRQKVDRGFDPQKIFEERRQCLSMLIGEWQSRAASGRFAMTQPLLEDIYKTQKTSSPTCAGWLTTIVGKNAEAEVHGSYLNALILAERKFIIADQKKAHLEALNLLTMKSGTQYYRAAQDVALFYVDDQDPQIREAAKNWVRNLPKLQTARQIMDFVRPDMLIASFTAASGGVRLINQLGTMAPGAMVNPTSVKAAIVSLGLHLGVFAKMTAAPNSLDSRVSRRFAVRGEMNKDWLLPLETDPFPDSVLDAYAARVPERFRWHISTDFDFISFLIMAQGNTDKNADPFLLEYDIRALRKLSEDIRGDLLEKRMSFLERIDAVRARVFQNAFVKAYAKNQPSLLHYVRGEGGNCVAQTQLFLALLYPHRDLFEDGWTLGFEILPYHAQAVLWNKSLNSKIDLVSGDQEKKIENGIYHPLVVVEGYLRRIKNLPLKGDASAEGWERYLSIAPSQLSKSQIMAKLKVHEIDLQVSRTRFELAPLVNVTGLGVQPEIPDRTVIKFNAIGERHRSVEQRISESRDLEVRSHRPLKVESYSPRDGKLHLSLDSIPNSSFFLTNEVADGSSLLIFQSDADRDEYDRKVSTDEKAEFLRKLVERDIENAYQNTLKIRNMLANPSIAIKLSSDKPEYIARFLGNTFDLPSFYARIVESEIVRGTDFGTIAITSDAKAMELRALSVNGFRRLFDLQVSLFKGLADNPELIATMAEDARIPNVNRSLIYTLLTIEPDIETVVALAKNGQKSTFPIILDRFAAAMAMPMKEMAAALANPRRIDVSAKKNDLRPLSVPSLKIGNVKTPADIEIKDLSSAKQKSADACPPDSSARCRAQEITWINTSGAVVYIAPETYTRLFGSAVHEMSRRRDHTMSAALANRWVDKAEDLITQTLLHGLKTRDDVGDTRNWVQRLIFDFEFGLKAKFGTATRSDLSALRKNDWAMMKTSKSMDSMHMLDLATTLSEKSWELKIIGMPGGAKAKMTPKTAQLYECLQPINKQEPSPESVRTCATRKDEDDKRSRKEAEKKIDQLLHDLENSKVPSGRIQMRELKKFVGEK